MALTAFNARDHITWGALTRCKDERLPQYIDCGHERAQTLGGSVAHPKVWQRAQVLCQGLLRMQHSTCSELSNHTYLRCHTNPKLAAVRHN